MYNVILGDELKLNQSYICNYSVLLDLKLIIRTPKVLDIEKKAQKEFHIVETVRFILR